MKYGALALLVIIFGGALFYFLAQNAPQKSQTETVDTSATISTSTMLTLESSRFAEDGDIPSKYTCDGANTVPPLSISGVPANAKSLVLIMDDPDIPDSVKKARGIDVFDHWVVFNIPTDTKVIEEGKEPRGVLGNNGAGKPGYTGPCPPDREHRYFFKLYAIDTLLDLSPGASRKDVEAAMEGHVVEKTELMAHYERQSTPKPI